MNVLIDCRPVRTPVSGVARYCIGLANALNELQHELSITALTQGQRAENVHLDQLNKGIVTHQSGRGFPSNKLTNALHEFAPWLAGKMIPGYFDLVHETYFANIAKNARRKIVTIHDVFPTEYPDNYSSRNVKYSTRNLWRQVTEADAIIAVSSYTKTRIGEITGCNPNKIVVIGNAVEHSAPRMACEPTGSLVDELLASGRPFFLCIGNIEPRKNIRRLVDAWRIVLAEYPEIKLVVAGRQVHDVENAVQYGRDTLGNDFIYCGEISEPEKWGLMHAMTAMVFPSLLEGYGIPVLEAYLCGKPCIFSESSALTELAIAPEQLFDPFSAEEIALRAIHVLQEQSRWRELAQQGQARAKAQTWGKVAAETASLYKHVCQ